MSFSSVCGNRFFFNSNSFALFFLCLNFSFFIEFGIHRAQGSKIILSSTSPGLFLLMLEYNKTCFLNLEFDLNDLLEKKEAGVPEMDYTEIKINVEMFLHLLNRHFVLHM